MKYLNIAVACLIAFTTCQPRESSLTSEETSKLSRALNEAKSRDSSRSGPIVDSVKSRSDEEINAAAQRIKFSGTYEIMYKGYNGNDSERFELAANGVAVWTHKASSGSSTKYGTWSADEYSISVSIKGNTGMITEDFRLKGTRLESVDDKDRYLKRLY